MAWNEPTGPLFMPNITGGILQCCCRRSVVFLSLLMLACEYRPPKSLKTKKLKQGSPPMGVGPGGGADLTSRHFGCDESESFRRRQGGAADCTSPFLPRTRRAASHGTRGALEMRTTKPRRPKNVIRESHETRKKRRKSNLPWGSFSLATAINRLKDWACVTWTLIWPFPVQRRFYYFSSLVIYVFQLFIFFLIRKKKVYVHLLKPTSIRVDPKCLFSRLTLSGQMLVHFQKDKFFGGEWLYPEVIGEDATIFHVAPDGQRTLIFFQLGN